MLLKDKVAVIAGDSFGIGQATALLFAREGAKVICVDDKAGLERAHKIRLEERDMPYYHADLSSSEQVRAVASEGEKTWPVVDILFNVAGLAVKKSFEETTAEAWSMIVGRNLTSGFLCSKYFLPLMKRAGSGSIINHASIDGFLGNPSLAAYSAAKGGLIPLTHVMAHDLAKYNIRVNCISTGGIRDPTAAAWATDEARIAATPSQRMGTPADVAHAALFLASDWSSFVNGANLVVDGGRTVITQGCYND